MERESFEDEEVAKILNDNYVCIKVDREERPDIDNIYMSVCQNLTGHGGWPLTIFMTYDMKPFFAGTYFPKDDYTGMRGLVPISLDIARLWKENRQTIIDAGEKITASLLTLHPETKEKISMDIIHNAYKGFKASFEEIYGGFGTAPKFPTPHNLMFLLRYWFVTRKKDALLMVEKTLHSMYQGGIFDHIGFGFSRYSTDRKWLVPHFEKMLYDNALLAIIYSEVYQTMGKKEYKETAEKIFTYILRDMTSAEGGFYSAEDADSEGVEGRFYVWTKEEIINILGEKDGNIFCKYYNIKDLGNFEGKSIPNLIHSNVPEEIKPKLEQSRKKLYEYRQKRVHPYKDNKILTSWNGMMIAALAMGGKIFENKSYTEAAEKAVSFIYSNLIREDGRLLARHREDESAIPAYIDDYAFLIWGLIELYLLSYNPSWLKKAVELNSNMIDLFWDDNHGGFFLYGKDSEKLISRPKEIYDGAVPSGNSVACYNLIKLSYLTRNSGLKEKADIVLQNAGESLINAPSAYSFILCAAMLSLSPVTEVVVVTDKPDYDDSMLKALRNTFNPFVISMLYSVRNTELLNTSPFLKNYKAVDNKPTAYVCENFSCKPPVTDAAALEVILQALPHPQT